MHSRTALLIAPETLVDGATMAELKATVRDLRALVPDSALADLVEAKLEALERDLARPYCDCCHTS